MALLVRDYDEAITWFTQKLGFELVEDTPRQPPSGVLLWPGGTGNEGWELLLARAADDGRPHASGTRLVAASSSSW
jgi:catechol 2,3-dioxygenase-like lactoylglutathione lyase family enzyme